MCIKRIIIVTLMAAGCAFAAPFAASPNALWFIFVDDLHVDFVNTGQLRNLLRAISSELIHDGELFAVRSSGQSSLSIELTSDRTRLEDALGHTHGNALRPLDILRITREAVEPNEVVVRATMSFSAAYQMIKSLERVHAERKAFIYVSNGYNFDPALADGATPRVRDHLWELTRVAGGAGVRIFAIDPRSLAGAPPPDPRVDSLAWHDYVRTTRNTLRVISEQTGGFALLEDRNPVEICRRIKDAVRN